MEIPKEELKTLSELNFTNNEKKLKNCNVYIITVPTPVDSNKKPDLSYLKSASEAIGGLINKKDVVIYESTVYPMATEDYCVPILEKYSKLKFNKDFFCGYSPERINPGDSSHSLTDIIKVTSGSNKETADFINELYPVSYTHLRAHET